MPDFGSLASVDYLGSMGFGVALWAYFFFFCAWRSKRAGLAIKEPVLALYSTTFKVLRWIALVLFIYAGSMMPLNQSLDEYLLQRVIPISIAAFAVVVAGGGIVNLMSFARYMKDRREDVVYEPIPKAKVLMWTGILSGVVVVFVGGQWFLQNMMEMDSADIADLFDAGSFTALLITFAMFWAWPHSVVAGAEEDDRSTIWAHSSGLELIRWGWLGIVLMAGMGVYHAAPGLDVLFDQPLNILAALALGFCGPMLYFFFFIVPVRSAAAKAEEGDAFAEKALGKIAFSGVFAYRAYASQSSLRGAGGDAQGKKQLCPTCLRPTNNIADYSSLNFEACPHCGSFIPPVFTVKDFVKNQTETLVPLLERAGDEKGKKRPKRKAEESELVQDLTRSLIAMAVADRGTDLHFVPETDKFVIRCRTDGFLYTMMEFRPLLERPIVQTLKVRAELDIAERRKPQDGKFEIEFGGRTIDIRVNTSPVGDGEMAALRLLYRQDNVGSALKLGMLSHNRKDFQAHMAARSGMILVTGPTGSGKSTTLYNALESMATGERNILTLEDPVEYKIKGLSQMQINETKGFTFTTGLRTILRQDPDVIMIGEIRDGDTAKMALDAAATGHLVMSTLHSTDSVSAISRLTDLGADPRRVSTVVLMILAQRLVRLICNECAHSYGAGAEQLEALGVWSCPEELIILRRGTGCPHCHETGFHGREGAYEFFVPNDELRALCDQGYAVPDIRKRARELGMRTLFEDAMTKAMLGHTTIEEAIAVNN